MKKILLTLLMFGSVNAMKPEDIDRKLKLDMLSTLLYTPYIMSLDSQDPDTIKIAAAADTLAHAIKASNLYHALNKSDSKEMTMNMMKVAAHVGLGFDSVNNCMNSKEIATLNKRLKRQLKTYKVNQMMQLGLEAVLRGTSYYNHKNGDQKTSDVTSELADFVGIFRAMNRFPVLSDKTADDMTPEEMVNNQGKNDQDMVKKQTNDEYQMPLETKMALLTPMVAPEVIMPDITSSNGLIIKNMTIPQEVKDVVTTIIRHEIPETIIQAPEVMTDLTVTPAAPLVTMSDEEIERFKKRNKRLNLKEDDYRSTEEVTWSFNKHKPDYVAKFGKPGQYGHQFVK